MDIEQGSELLNPEEAVLKKIRLVLETQRFQTDPMLADYRELAADYEKLSRQMRKLVKISDKQQMQLNRLNEELNEKNSMLEDRELHLMNLVEEKTRKIERITIALVNALEDANLLNDMDTGNHIKRVSRYSSILATHYGCDREFVKRIELYASLHDIGKVGIPDNVLKKKGRFTPDEFDIMKQHVVIGHKMLDNEDLDQMAKNIVLFHHEKWDGSGYVNGLQGVAIPLEARIVSLADVYDALISKRSYKPAFSDNEADTIIKSGAGNHFDPELVDVFFANRDELREVREVYR